MSWFSQAFKAKTGTPEIDFLAGRKDVKEMFATEAVAVEFLKKLPIQAVSNLYHASRKVLGINE